MVSSIVWVTCSVLPRVLTQEGKELKGTCISPLSTTKSRIDPRHPRESSVLDQNFVVFLMIPETKRQQPQSRSNSKNYC